MALLGLGAVTLSHAASDGYPAGPDAALDAFYAGRLDDAASLWRERAEKQSDPEAMYRLGLLAKGGHEPSGGIESAAVWFRRAANQGHAGAAYELGRLYWDGIGVVQGKSLAKSYWRDAAELDLPEAQYELAQAYRDTDHTRAAELKARFWVRRAAEQGYPRAVAEVRASTPSEQAAPDIAPVTAVEPEPKEESPAPDTGDATAAEASTSAESEAQNAEAAPVQEVDVADASDGSEAPSEPTPSVDAEPAPDPVVNETSAADALTLYAYRSETGPPLMTVSSAQDLEPIASDGDWTRVRVAGGLFGWVSADFLDISGSEAKATTNVRVRVLPGLTDEAVPMDSGLKSGDRVEVMEVSDGWAHVRLPERFSAWIRTAALGD